MKIAVIGPQNTGKSTFINDFIKNFDEYSTPEKSYRDVITEKNLQINQQTTEESQKILRDFLFKQTKDNEKQNIIFDRCVIDNYAYTTCGKESGANIDREFLEETKKIMYKSLESLDYIIFIPTAVSVTLVNDDLRDTNTLFIDKINRMFIDLLLEISSKNVIKIITVTGDRDDRIEQVKTKLIYKQN